jgi:D-3-phosphoglycerate dehydrogenase
VTQKFFDEASIAYLKQEGCEVEIAALPGGKNEGGLDVDDIRALLDRAAGWIVGHANITREVLEALPGLRIVSRRGVGYERVDLQAAKDLGRVVTIAAGGNDATVADQVIGMMIGLGRRFREAQANMEQGDWRILLGNDLFESTVGIVGLGRIGRSLVKRLRGFDAEILIHTPRPDPVLEREAGVRFASLETVLRESDYISLHAPLNDDTRHMINRETLGQMKPGAFLVNTARGGLVDDAALLDALERQQIAGAGLDVFESEADPARQEITRRLIGLPNVIAAPHAGASTVEGLNRTNLIAARCVVDVLDGRTPPPACVVVDGRG